MPYAVRFLRDLFGLRWALRKPSITPGADSRVPSRMGNHNSIHFCGIPEGKGPHKVGCTDLMSDYTIQGTFLRLFYPRQDVGNEYEDAQWIPRREYYSGLADTLKLNRTVVDVIFSNYFGSVKCPAKLNAPFKPGERYPLVIFSHGLGAFRTLYSAICIGLASQGFVVAAVEHRDESASATFYFREKSSADPCEEGECSSLEEVWLYNKVPKPGADEFPFRFEQVKTRAEECRRALDLMLSINGGKPVTNALPSTFDWLLLKDSIDVQRMATAGHSFGAATAIKALCMDSRFKCAIALDAWMFPLRDEIFSSITQPVIFVNSEKFQWVDNIILMKKMDSTTAERKMITIKGAVHQSFPDFTFLTGHLVGKIFKLKGDIDVFVAMDIIIHVTLAFLQRHLGLQKDFDQWDPLIDGKGEFVIPGTNLVLPPVPVPNNPQ